MKSDVIRIDNQEHGFSEAVKEAQKVAAYKGLSQKDSLRLQLCTEEVLSLVRSVTGEIEASFWIEHSGSQYDLHVSANTAMDMEKRDIFEETMVVEVKQNNQYVYDGQNEHTIVCSDPEWDGYEHSTLKKLADTIKVSIRGGAVELIVSKRFA